MTVWSPESTPATGTTTDSYVEALEVDSRFASDSTFVITNTGGANSLDYDVLVYSNHASGKPFTTTSGTISHSDEDEVILVRHSKIVVRVKSSSAGNHTTYQIDSIGGR